MAQDTENRPGAIKRFVSKLRGTNVGQALFSRHTVQLGKAGRFAVFQVKLWSHCVRLLKKNRAGQQAAALSYYTIFGFVPVVIVILLLFQSFSADDVGQNVKSMFYDQLEVSGIKYATDEGDVLLADHLDEIVQRFYEGLNTGSLTLISGALIIWAALALLSKIEKAFNNIWHVARGRGFVHRIINYWAVLTLGPLLIAVGFYLAKQYADLEGLQNSIPHISRIGGVLLSYLLTALVFFLLYFVLPNTKVRAQAAIWGAGVAALIWTPAKWGFDQYVTEFIPYSKVYGVVGLVPLAVFWVFVTWLIVLFGLQVTYTTQHLTTLDAADIAASRKNDGRFIANDITAINVVRTIAEAFGQNNAPLEAEALCGALDLPPEFGRKILDHLVEKGIIVKTSAPNVGYVPARDPANIKLSEIADAVADAGFAQSIREGGDKLDQIVISVRSALGEFSVKQIIKANPPGTGSVRQIPLQRRPSKTISASDTGAEQAQGPPPSPPMS